MSDELVVRDGAIELARFLEGQRGRWFHFSQTNVRGYYTPPGMEVYVRAETEEEAQAKLEAQPGYTTDFCECCGDRWYGPEEVTIDKIKEWVQLTSDWRIRRSRSEGIPAYHFIL